MLSYAGEPDVHAGDTPVVTFFCELVLLTMRLFARQGDSGCGSSRWKRGSHQLYLPINRIDAGTRTRRTTVASSATATAIPSPSCCTGNTPVKVKAVKTATIRNAAPEISGAVDDHSPGHRRPVVEAGHRLLPDPG